MAFVISSAQAVQPLHFISNHQFYNYWQKARRILNSKPYFEEKQDISYKTKNTVVQGL